MTLLILAFLAAAAVVWVSGHTLSTTTDELDDRFNLGEAYGGAIFLAIATNLPEIAITISASIHRQLGLAVGNILGGIAIQTVVLAILDFIVMRKRNAPLITASGSLIIVVQACALAGILAIAIAGTFLPHTIVFLRMSLPTVMIAFGWIGALYLTKLAHNTGMPWSTKFRSDSQEVSTSALPPLARTIAIFGVASLATLIAGYVLEVTGEQVAKQLHMTGALFGATILAATTSLPELTTGLTAVKMGYYELAISDIIGGNAFLPVLFLVAVLITNESVLPSAAASDVYLGSLGVVVTMIYACGGLFRSTRRIAGMGVDSFLVVVTYLMGIAGLLALPSTH